MSGKAIVKIIEKELFLKDISKREFYDACGVTSTTLSNWRNEVYTPSPQKLQVIANYLGISLDDLIDDRDDDDTVELREALKDRFDLRVLLNSAKDMPASSVYTLIAQLEKMKEENKEDATSGRN